MRGALLARSMCARDSTHHSPTTMGTEGKGTLGREGPRRGELQGKQNKLHHGALLLVLFMMMMVTFVKDTIFVLVGVGR